MASLGCVIVQLVPTYMDTIDAYNSHVGLCVRCNFACNLSILPCVEVKEKCTVTRLAHVLLQILPYFPVVLKSTKVSAMNCVFNCQ